MIEVIDAWSQILVDEEGGSVRSDELIRRVRVVEWPFATKDWSRYCPGSEFVGGMECAIEAAEEPKEFPPGSP